MIRVLNIAILPHSPRHFFAFATTGVEDTTLKRRKRTYGNRIIQKQH
jgi:hypothetical protein